jgi:Domain of unknown function (DUF1877)
MSMICYVLGLSPPQIRMLRSTPSLASDVAVVAQRDQRAHREAARNRLSPEGSSAAEAQYRAMIETMPGRKEAEAQIAEARERLAGIGPFEQALDLQKSWHILHYLFTGTVYDSGAPGDALVTGEDWGEDLAGYGPARLHDEAATRDFGRFLATLELERLQARMNYQEMMRVGVYGMPMGPGTDSDYEGELRAEVASYFPALRDYIAKMSEQGYGLLLWLS